MFLLKRFGFNLKDEEYKIAFVEEVKKDTSIKEETESMA